MSITPLLTVLVATGVPPCRKAAAAARAVLRPRAGILEDGHPLRAVDDGLDGRLLRVLAGQPGLRHVAVGREGFPDGTGGRVVGGQDEDRALGGRG